MFLLSYRNTCKSFREHSELSIAVETTACSYCSHSLFCSNKLPLFCLYFDKNPGMIFLFGFSFSLIFGFEKTRKIVLEKICLQKHREKNSRDVITKLCVCYFSFLGQTREH